MSEQTTPSLLEQLQAHHQAGYLSLHMPGHKENAALAPYLAQLGAEWDITELPGFDDLHAPEGILAKMMDRAAALWGSRKSCLLVNGSTGGLLAAMRGTTRRGDKILVARHCHKAIYHAMELCGLDPVFLTPATEPTFGLAGSITPEQVAEALAQHPDVKLIVYPSPTYDGILSDTAGICAVAMTGLGTDDTMPTRLAEALLALDEAAGPNEEPPAEPLPAYELPPRRMSLEEAAMAPGGLTFLYDGIGKVCGEYIWAYPPGIPLVTPGEEITASLVETVETLYRSGVRLLGTRGKPPFTTFAVADEENQ